MAESDAISQDPDAIEEGHVAIPILDCIVCVCMAKAYKCQSKQKCHHLHGDCPKQDSDWILNIANFLYASMQIFG